MKKKVWVVISCILLILISIIILTFSKIYYTSNSIKNIYINNENKIVIELYDDKDTYCLIDDKENNIWIKSINKKCVLDYKENNNYIFLKNKLGYVTKFNNTYNLDSIKKFEIKNNKVYLAINGSEKIDYFLDSIVDKTKNIKFVSKDDSIAKVDSEGIITGIDVGTTEIDVILDDFNIKVEVVVTDNIIVPGNDYDYKRDYITCDEFSKEDNDLVDEILFNRISKVGKYTRAAVVEAARFMTLEFSKRIPYFAENGRLSMNGIDGEGRYYHEGMFLNSSRYSLIEDSMHGPKVWGCKMYSYPVNRTIPNGLDCSGFVSWAFINAGFDVGDIGAGITPVKDFTDLGIKKNIKNSIKDNSIIVGDLLSGKFSNGGHIAILVGIKDGYYYVSESLYEDNHTYYGVITRKYKFEELSSFFSWHIDMSDFYLNDGILTDYWLN